MKQIGNSAERDAGMPPSFQLICKRKQKYCKSVHSWKRVSLHASCQLNEKLALDSLPFARLWLMWPGKMIPAGLDSCLLCRRGTAALALYPLVGEDAK